MLFAFCKIPTVVVPLLVVFTPPQRISQKENIPPRLPLAGCRPRRISRMHSLNTSSTFSPLYALVSMYFALYRSAMDAPVSEETISLLLFTKSFLLATIMIGWKFVMMVWQTKKYTDGLATPINDGLVID